MTDVEPAGITDSATARSPKWLCAAVIGMGILAYANSLNGPFIFDDLTSIPENPNIRCLWPLTRAMSSPPCTSVSGRPIVCLSLAVNYAVGGLNPQGYHIVNLAIHLGSALLLLGIVRRMLLSPTLAGRFRQAATWLAGATVTIWLVHPLQTEAVTYVVQRTELLVSFFYLLTLYCAIRGWGSSRPGIWFAGAIVACALGMGSKEVMVSAPIIVFLYDRTFVSRSWKEALGRHAALYFCLAGTWLVLAYLLGTGARNASAGLQLHIRPLDYLATQAGVIAWYLRLCFWPAPLVISYDDWPVATSLAQVLPQGLLVLALLAGTIWAIWRRSPLGFLGGWFFLILAPSSSVIPIVTEIAAERRMYMPLAAVVVLVLCGADRFLGVAPLRLSLPRRLFDRMGAGLAIIAAGALLCVTISRNRDYQSALSIWGDTAAKRPRISFAQFELGNALAADGKVDDAIARYREALRLKPAYHEAHTNLANLLADRGQSEEAVLHYEEAIRIEPGFPEAHNNLGTVLTSQGKLDKAIYHYNEALRKKPSWPAAHSNLGFTLAKLGRFDEAINHFHEAIKADPNLPQPHFCLAEALAAKGRLNEAIEHYKAVLQLDPNYPAVRERLDAAMTRRGAAGRAVSSEPAVKPGAGSE